MKKYIKILPVVVLLILLSNACSGGGNKRNADFLPPMSIEISDDIKDKTELVEMIQSSEKAINEFSDNMEQLIIDGKDVLSKKDEEQSLMDGLKAGKLMVEFVSNSTQMVTAMEKFDTYVTSQKEQGMINDEQLKALEQVGKAFSARADEINKKYAHYLEK